ncbi:MAG: DUF4178 domain-containing protein [Sphingomonadales bacterium]|nr:DUF4178 domain-containing protein [Sphingomonadales bacterium]MDE2169630.1 DUF4178 domain-containing protein [Sphingomonadales bacterium]
MSEEAKASRAKSGARAITCPSCGGTIGIKAAGYTVSVACLYCGTVLDVAHEDVRVIAEYHQAVARLDIPLGTRGTLFGVEWEVVGWLERSGAGATWQEYLLFNPYAGYRWLVGDEGAWHFGTMLTDTPVMVADTLAQWRGRGFELEDAPIQIVTRRVLGEFYWRVRSGDVVEAASFAASGQTLSCEWNDTETQWTQLIPLAPRQVKAAFTPPGAGPQPQDAPSRGWFARFWSLPFADRDDLVPMFGIGVIGVLASLIVMTALAGNGGGITAQTMVEVDGGTTHGQYGPLTISRPSQMVTVGLAMQTFTNKWIDVDLALVERQSHQAIHAGTTIQHYSGSDSDGDWEEGSHGATVEFADVPRGTYDLTIQAQGHSWHSGTQAADPAGSGSDPLAAAESPWGVKTAEAPPVTVLAMGFSAEKGGVDWALFWTVAGLILVLPIGVFLYRLSQGRLS